MPRHHDSNLERAGVLLREAEQLLALQRPMVVAAALASESAPFACWSVDMGGKLIWCNAEFEAQFAASATIARGMALAESFGIGTPLSDILTTHDRDVMATKRTWRYEAAIGGADARRIVKWPLYGEDGTTLGVCGAIS